MKSEMLSLRGPRLLLWASVSGVGALGWAALFTSLAMGRTTPLAASREWLATFLAATMALLAWESAFGLALWRLRRRNPSGLPVKAVVSTLPLLLAYPLLVAVYGSDDIFHFLSANPIPRSLATWSLPLAVLLWQEATLLWNLDLSSRIDGLLRRRHAAALLVFMAFALLYLFTAGGHLYSPDESTMFLATQSLAERGSVAIPRDAPAIAAGQAPYWYSKYGLVPSLLALPAYFFSRLVGWEPEPPSVAFPIPNGAYPPIDLLVGPLATAATCALLFSLARRLGFRAATSLAVAVAYGVGTSAWVYSKTFFSQPPAALFFLAGAYLLGDRPPRSDKSESGCAPDPLRCASAGVMLGLAAGSRAEMLIIALPLMVLPAHHMLRFRGAAVAPLAAFAGALLATCGATVGWYNYAKTGSLFLTGHGGQGTLAGFSSEPYIGLFGTLFSPGFGLLVYNPIVIAGVFSLPLLALRRALEAYVFGVLLLLAALFYGSFDPWFAGFTWANRYLVVVLPFAVLPAAALLERPWRSPMSVMLLGGTAALGFGVNLLAVLFDFNNGWLDLWERRANLDLILWDPHFSPILAHVRLLWDFLFTGAKLDLYLYYKLGVPALVGFPLLITALAILAARSAVALDHADPNPDTGLAGRRAG